LGDVVNLSSRFMGEARWGMIVVAEDVAETVKAFLERAMDARS
jgi:class 3 adenylate cyclase